MEMVSTVFFLLFAAQVLFFNLSVLQTLRDAKLDGFELKAIPHITDDTNPSRCSMSWHLNG